MADWLPKKRAIQEFELMEQGIFFMDGWYCSHCKRVSDRKHLFCQSCGSEMKNGTMTERKVEKWEKYR